MKAKRWTADDINDLLRLRDAGLNLFEISETMGVSARTVARKLKGLQETPAPAAPSRRERLLRLAVSTPWRKAHAKYRRR